MADDKTQAGRSDRERVAEDQPYEMDRLMKKYKVSAGKLREIVRAVGPMRIDVEAALQSYVSPPP